MAARSSTANLGLTGIPLFIAIELMLYGRGEQSHEEKMTHLHKAYAWIRGYLPVLYEKKDEPYTSPRIPQLKCGEVVKVSISDVVNDTAEEITALRNKYSSTFEGVRSCTQEEKEFIKLMDGIFERLTLIVSFSGIADKMSTTEEVYF